MPSSTSIPIIVQGNTFSLAIPLQIYQVSGGSMVLQDYTPDPTDEISIQLKGERRQYTYTPTVDGNICNIGLSGNELAGNYSVVVSIVKTSGQRLRSFRTDQFFIVESSDDLTPADIIEGLEENVIYLNSSIFVAGEDGRGIESIVKTSTSGLVDTYTITYTDATTSTFNVTNGAQGQDGQQGADGVGIASIEKTATVGLVDTYTITLSNGTTTTFDVTNGKDGVDLGLATIVNDLTTGGATDVLSAEMGKVLNDKSVGEVAKNLFSLDGWQDKYYLPNATGSTNNNWDTTGYISIENGKTYSFRIGTAIPTSIYNYYTMWDESKSYLGTATFDTTTGTLTINNANAKYLRISIYGNGGSYTQANGTSIKRAHTKFFIMFNEGASPLAFDAFGVVSIKSNIKSDYVKDTIMVDKRNLFDWDNYVTGNIVDGVYTSTGNYKVTPFIDVSMYGEMLLQWCKNGSNNSNGVLFAYDENQNPLFTIPCPYNSTGGYLVPSYAKYVRGYNTNLLLTLAIGQAIPDKLHEPTPKINVDYIPFLSRLEGKTIAFLGDSFTAMATYPNTAFTLLQSAQQFNWGSNAWKYTALQSLLQSHQADIPSLDAIVILGGANDFASSDGTAGLVTACRSLVSYIYSQNPTILILHLTPTYTYGYTPPGGTQRTDTDANGVHISQYAQAIKDTCDEIGVPVLDTYRTLGITQYNVASMTRDGLHPTEEVYKKMGWQVAKKLGEL